MAKTPNLGLYCRGPYCNEPDEIDFDRAASLNALLLDAIINDLKVQVEALELSSGGVSSGNGIIDSGTF